MCGAAVDCREAHATALHAAHGVAGQAASRVVGMSRGFMAEPPGLSRGDVYTNVNHKADRFSSSSYEMRAKGEPLRNGNEMRARVGWGIKEGGVAQARTCIS